MDFVLEDVFEKIMNIDTKKYDRFFEPIVLAKWDGTKSADNLKLLFDKPQKAKITHLALPLSLVEEYTKEAENIIIGSNGMLSVSQEEYTAVISLKLEQKIGAKFILLDSHADSLQEINAKMQAALSANIPVFVVLGESFNEFFEGKTVDVLKTQIEAVLLDISAKQLQNVSLIYSTPWIEIKGAKELQETLHQAYGIFRLCLEEKLGAKKAALVRVLCEISVRIDLSTFSLDKSTSDGIYFCNPTSFSKA